MKIRYFRWLFAGLAALLLITGFVPPDEPAAFGISAGWNDGNYLFAGGTASWRLGFAALIVALYILLMGTTPVDPGKPVTGVFKAICRILARLWPGDVSARSGAWHSARVLLNGEAPGSSPGLFSA